MVFFDLGHTGPGLRCWGVYHKRVCENAVVHTLQDVQTLVVQIRQGVGRQLGFDVYVSAVHAARPVGVTLNICDPYFKRSHEVLSTTPVHIGHLHGVVGPPFWPPYMPDVPFALHELRHDIL